MLKLSENDFINNLLQHITPTPPNHLLIVEKNLEGNFSDVNPVELVEKFGAGPVIAPMAAVISRAWK